MSWNKNTVVSSHIEIMVSLFKEHNIPYTLTEIGQVQGNGLNDRYCSDKSDFRREITSFQEDEHYPDYHVVKYKLYRLDCGEKVYLEKIVRYTDCDSDDYVSMSEFNKAEFKNTLSDLSNWKLEEVIVND